MISLRLGVLEDQIPDRLLSELDLPRAWAPGPGLAFWRAALARLERDECFRSPWLNPELAAHNPDPDPVTIELLLCSRPSFEEMVDIPGALGAHLVSTHDSDPFREENPHARAYRVLMVSEREEFLSLTEDLAKDDLNPERYFVEYMEAYLNTAFHEIAHALLFAENAALLSPADIAALSEAGEIGHDVFDCSTGYGIRPLSINGEDTWAEDMEEALGLMEAHVEERGRNMMLSVLTDSLSPANYPAAFGVEKEIEAIICPDSSPS